MTLPAWMRSQLAYRGIDLTTQTTTPDHRKDHPMSEQQNDFQAREFAASQAVYQQIVNGGVPGGDVEAALMNAHLNASNNEK